MSFVRIQLRRGFVEDWVDGNPILAPGEIGLEIDTGKFKLGNGVQTWSELQYAQATAYDIAVNNGFDGTEEEWLDTLITDLSIAAVFTVDYGEPAQVILEGEHPEKTLKFYIPKGQPGPQGQTGPQGPPGVPGPAGPTNIVWRGVWDPSIDYDLNDAVYHNDVTWFSADDPNIGEEPQEGSDYWYRVTLNVIGEEGPQGPEGPPGPGVDNLSELNDVDLSSLQNGDGLVYNSSIQKWVPGAAVTNIDSLTDVSVSNAENKQSLVFDASTSTWKPGPAIFVQLTEPTGGQAGDLWFW